jgi:hypothetical protein
MLFTTIRSKRRTIAIQVDQNGLVTVRTPLHIPDHKIDAFVEKHQDWINKKVHSAVQKQASTQPRHFVAGDYFWFLGKEYPLQINKDSQKSNLLLNENTFILKQNCEDPRKAFVTWYKKQASIWILERLDQYVKERGLAYRKISITSAKTRWGSCTARKHLNFSWRLMMLPPDIIEYVIVHELAHLKFMNHSAKFWEHVASFDKESKAKRKWLREHQHNYNL